MRLIDAEETIRSIVTTSYSENDEAIKATAKAIVTIEHSPTIVEFEGDINKVIVKGEEYHRIVRCKDCKYSVDYYNDGECYCRRPGRELQWIGRRWDFFCAAGRKKGEDDD